MLMVLADAEFALSFILVPLCMFFQVFIQVIEMLLPGYA
jgi:hypothetical protein